MHNFFRPGRNGYSAGSEVTHRPMGAEINRCRLDWKVLELKTNLSVTRQFFYRIVAPHMRIRHYSGSFNLAKANAIHFIVQIVSWPLTIIAMWIEVTWLNMPSDTWYRVETSCHLQLVKFVTDSNWSSILTWAAYLGWRLLNLFPLLRYFPNFQSHQNTGHLWNITFIFDRCRCS